MLFRSPQGFGGHFSPSLAYRTRTIRVFCPCSQIPRDLSMHLTRIIHDCEDTKSLFCYKHVVETVFVVAREAFACPTIARHRSEEHTSELQSLRHLVCRL